MQYIFTGARLLLGVVFITFGLNGFFGFIPVPEFHHFMELMVESGFIVPVKVLEVLAGLLLVSQRFTGLGLLFLGPLITNIAMYHIFFDARNWQVLLLIIPLYLLSVYSNWKLFKPFFKPRN